MAAHATQSPPLGVTQLPSADPGRRGVSDRSPAAAAPPPESVHWFRRVRRVGRRVRRPIIPTGRRLAAAGIVVAVVAVVAIGVSVEREAHRDLLNVRAAVLEDVVAGLVGEGLLPLPTNDPDAMGALDDAVRLRLLGGEAVRVKLWSPTGEIVYSDAPDLIGTQFPLDDDVSGALAGETHVGIGTPDAAENVTEQHFGQLIELYIPVEVGDSVVSVFEVYEIPTSFRATLSEIRRHVWVNVAIGLGSVLTAFGAVALAHARAIDRRRREAEVMLGETLTAADDERRRLIGALHDDIGQPLYRVLYGLEGCRMLVAADPVAAAEMEAVTTLVRQIEGSLRSELRVQASGLIGEDGLNDALARLAAATHAESGLEVEFRPNDVPEVSEVAATALFRATQEALVNVRKHARADRVIISLTAGRDRLVMTIADDGKGWNGTRGLGLTTTSDRLGALYGGFSIRRRRPRGTVVTAWVPVRPEGAAA